MLFQTAKWWNDSPLNKKLDMTIYYNHQHLHRLQILTNILQSKKENDSQAVAVNAFEFEASLVYSVGNQYSQDCQKNKNNKTPQAHIWQSGTYP